MVLSISALRWTKAVASGDTAATAPPARNTFHSAPAWVPGQRRKKIEDGGDGLLRKGTEDVA